MLSSCALQVVSTLFAVSIAFADDTEQRSTDRTSPQATIKGYLRAFGDADFEVMRTYYDQRVTVLRGSTLLSRRYGISQNDDRSKSQTVDRDLLLKAYATAVEQFGGKDEWRRHGKRFSRFPIEFLDKNSKDADKIFKAIGAKPNNVVAVVNPQGDELAFVLRQNEKGRWFIVSEFWD